MVVGRKYKLNSEVSCNFKVLGVIGDGCVVEEIIEDDLVLIKLLKSQNRIIVGMDKLENDIK